MSKSVRQTPLARRDLVDILDYLERTVGAEVADRFFVKASACFGRLAAHPGLGVRSLSNHPSLADVRSTSLGGQFKRYVVFYRPVPEGIEVLRVFHGARDVSSLLNAISPDEDQPGEAHDP